MTAGRRNEARPARSVPAPPEQAGLGLLRSLAELAARPAARGERQPTEAHGVYQLEPISRRDARY
jgi:hypothetical protein